MAKSNLESAGSRWRWPDAWRWRERAKWRPLPSTLGALAICAVGLALRMYFATDTLAQPRFDEKEVVEQGVAFMGGDLRYHFPKYGPFTMYVLAGIYHVLAVLHGLSPLDYASRVFFDGEEHYFVGRVYIGWTLTVLAFAAFLQFRRHHGAAPGLLACALLGLPFVDVLVEGARIDMAQAALQGLTLLALGEAAARPRLRHWAVAGVCAGLAIATKPLPGALVLPCFVPAAWFASKHARAAGERWYRRIAATLLSPGAWLGAACCAGAAIAANPTMLPLSTFLRSQRAAMKLHSGHVAWRTQSLPESLAELGTPFSIGLVLALLLVVFRRDVKALLVALFFAIYVGAFWGRPSRNYYMVAAAVAAALLVAHGLAVALELSHTRTRPWLKWAWLPLAGCFVLGPMRLLWARSLSPSKKIEAREWIEANVPAGTGIFYLGRRPVGPRLVATDRKYHMNWSTSLHYGRKEYVFFKRAFQLAHDRYVESGRPTYAITGHFAKSFARREKKLPRYITDSLVKKARANGWQYIVLSEIAKPNVLDLGYKWFPQAILEQQFGRVAVFRVPALDPTLNDVEPRASTANAVSVATEPTPASPDSVSADAGPPAADEE